MKGQNTILRGEANTSQNLMSLPVSIDNSLISSSFRHRHFQVTGNTRTEHPSCLVDKIPGTLNIGKSRNAVLLNPVMNANGHIKLYPGLGVVHGKLEDFLARPHHLRQRERRGVALRVQETPRH
jgi:hypothetical protein